MVSRLAPFQHAFAQRLSELGIVYNDSPIIEGPGTRYFNDSLRGGNIRSKFLLFAQDGDSLQSARESFQSYSEIVELRPSHEPGIQLVRPDGYVAYATHSNDVDKAFVAVNDLLQSQMQPTQHKNLALRHNALHSSVS